jgi:hypothetical protein
LSCELVDRAFVALDDPDQRLRLGQDRLVHVVGVRVSRFGQHVSSSPDSRTCSSALGYQYVTRLRRDALQPHADRREVLKIEAPLVRDVGVGVEGDVRNRVTPPDEELPAFQVLLHDPERVVTELLFDLQGGPAFFRHLRVEDVKPGACHGYVRLVAVLLDVLSFFTETTPRVSNKPSNAPVTSASPSAYMVTLRRIIL